MSRKKIWQLSSKYSQEWNYMCEHCDVHVQSNNGYFCKKGQSEEPSYDDHYEGYIAICTNCHRPSFFDYAQDYHQMTNRNIRISTPHKEVNSIFKEAVDSLSAGAYTASAMCCRKLLMNISVKEGAEGGNSFEYYVNWLDDNRHLPPKWKDEATIIRKSGNKANHEIEIISEDDADKIINLSYHILLFMYKLN